MEHSERFDSEQARLNILESMDIMDTAPETCFDQLTFLASKICDTPIALISFINSHRQWFKSTHGMTISEIPKFLSACNRTIIEKNEFQICDAQIPGSPYSDYMTEHNFRFYAGVPISSKEDVHVGTLCVIDYEPKSLSSEQLESLKAIASQISDLLEMRRIYKDNLVRLKEMGEASYAKEKLMQEVAHKAKIKTIAELSTGLAFKIRPLAIGIEAVADQLKAEPDKQLVLRKSAAEILTIFNSLEKFIEAEKEKSMRVIEVKSLLQNVISHLEYRTKNKNINLKFESNYDELMCIGNVAQLKQVFFEIIANAVDAVEPMEEREICVHLDEINHNVQVKVKDSGKGIPPEVEPFIFQPFFTTKGSYSLGTGLCLAQNLIQRHSGDIRLERAYGPTTFTVTLPKP